MFTETTLKFWRSAAVQLLRTILNNFQPLINSFFEKRFSYVMILSRQKHSLFVYLFLRVYLFSSPLDENCNEIRFHHFWSKNFILQMGVKNSSFILQFAMSFDSPFSYYIIFSYYLIYHPLKSAKCEVSLKTLEATWNIYDEQISPKREFCN